MEIKRGTYRLEARGLVFDLVDDLNLNNGPNCFYFRGGNGFGKTSFLEKIIIPALKTDTVQYVYIGQDIRTQLYTLKALLSVQGIKVSGSDEVELLRLWINHSRSARVFILDEFDKYFADYGFIFDWSAAFIRTYIIVSHLAYHQSEAVAQKYPVCNVRFDLIDFDGHIRNVRITKE
ncbi:MAG: hypothetical protein PVH74_13200 [Desulfobacterales bacterium]|jgi:hypothetical protein